MSNELILGNMNTALVVTKPEYNLMLKNIQDRMPAVTRDTSNFHKSHSQFMSVTLDVTAITPIRSIKHTLAEIDRIADEAVALGAVWVLITGGEPLLRQDFADAGLEEEIRAIL